MQSHPGRTSMATIKQTLANRPNSLKSTGPRSPSGRAASPINARKHGLSRLGTMPPSAMADAIAARKERWRNDYRPQGDAQEWVCGRICGESVRLDVCERRILSARAEAAEQAA